MNRRSFIKSAACSIAAIATGHDQVAEITGVEMRKNETPKCDVCGKTSTHQCQDIYEREIGRFRGIDGHMKAGCDDHPMVVVAYFLSGEVLFRKLDAISRQEIHDKLWWTCT